MRTFLSASFVCAATFLSFGCDMPIDLVPCQEGTYVRFEPGFSHGPEFAVSVNTVKFEVRAGDLERACTVDLPAGTAECSGTGPEVTFELDHVDLNDDTSAIQSLTGFRIESAAYESLEVTLHVDGELRYDAELALDVQEESCGDSDLSATGYLPTQADDGAGDAGGAATE